MTDMSQQVGHRKFFDYLIRQWAFQRSELERLNLDPRKDTVGLHHSICTHMLSEVHELLDCLPWFLHKKPKVAERYALVEECVDVFKWLLNIMHLHGIECAEFEQVFDEKTAVVEDRIRTIRFIERMKIDPVPCLVLDLDGVIVDRDTAILEFYDRKHGIRYNSLAFLRSRLTAKDWEELKFEFYRSGAFQRSSLSSVFLPDVLRDSKSVPKVIITARDVKMFPQIHYQTLQFLKLLNIPYDALIFAKDKSKAVYNWLHPDSYFFDDEQIHVDDMSKVCKSFQVFGNDKTSVNIIAQLASKLEQRKGEV